MFLKKLRTHNYKSLRNVCFTPEPFAGLAILVASADLRTSLLLIEEPENSVHPWIVRKLVERLKEVSKTKKSSSPRNRRF